MSRSTKNNVSGRPNQPDEQLASEFALGILRNEERDRAEFMFANDPSFRLMVEDWRERVDPMLEETEEDETPETVWNELESQLFGDKDEEPSSDPVDSPNDDAPESTGLWTNLIFWRRLSFITIAAAAVLFSMVALRIGELPAPADKSGFVAALNLAENEQTFLLQMDMNSGVLNIRAANLSETEDRVLELWLMPEGGEPLSLGVIFPDGSTALNIATSALKEFKVGTTLAVSLEPATGAPNGKPSTPFIAKGPLQII